MFIIHAASEFAPVAKVGGLADVLLGLCRELTWKGHSVEIVLPYYDCMDKERIEGLALDEQRFTTQWAGQKVINKIYRGKVEGLNVTFIAPEHSLKLFDRGHYYGDLDDTMRFGYFARSLLEYLQQFNKQPDVLHLHDWQLSLAATLYRKVFHGLHLKKIVLTIHNIEYQGWTDEALLTESGLAPLPELMHNGIINLLKGGIVFCDILTTVSPNYSFEVQTPEGGKGLDELLRQYKSKFYGILNGVDYSYWNPAIDRFLPTNYCLEGEEIDATLQKKREIKHTLQKKLNLEPCDKPLVGAVTRLVPQKGIEQIKQALYRTLEKGGQFLLLGSSPLPEIQKEFLEIKESLKCNRNIHMELSYNEELSHLFYAAGDILVLPSLFEPCGLTQLIGLKYGTIPVVRKTGGLADTIFDIDFSRKPIFDRNGYVFDNPDEMGIYSALDRALECCIEEPAKWHTLIQRALKMDFSWNRPADKYLELYKK